MKWKTIFWDSHGIFMTPNKIQKLINKNKLIILDTRTRIEYNERHLKGSLLVKPLNLKEEIISRGSKLNVLVVGRGLRTHLQIVSELQREGYRVKLVDRTLDKWDNMNMIAKKKS